MKTSCDGCGSKSFEIRFLRNRLFQVCQYCRNEYPIQEALNIDGYRIYGASGSFSGPISFPLYTANWCNQSMKEF